MFKEGRWAIEGRKDVEVRRVGMKDIGVCVGGYIYNVGFPYEVQVRG